MFRYNWEKLVTLPASFLKWQNVPKDCTVSTTQTYPTHVLCGACAEFVVLKVGNGNIHLIMKHYSYYGLNEFIICCGYKGYVIKEYFSNNSFSEIKNLSSNAMPCCGSTLQLPPSGGLLILTYIDVVAFVSKPLNATKLTV